MQDNGGFACQLGENWERGTVASGLLPAAPRRLTRSGASGGASCRPGHLAFGIAADGIHACAMTTPGFHGLYDGPVLGCRVCGAIIRLGGHESCILVARHDLHVVGAVVRPGGHSGHAWEGMTVSSFSRFRTSRGAAIGDSHSVDRTRPPHGRRPHSPSRALRDSVTSGGWSMAQFISDAEGRPHQGRCPEGYSFAAWWNMVAPECVHLRS
jgi:hypothetical protein